MHPPHSGHAPCWACPYLVIITSWSRPLTASFHGLITSVLSTDHVPVLVTGSRRTRSSMCRGLQSLDASFLVEMTSKPRNRIAPRIPLEARVNLAAPLSTDRVLVTSAIHVHLWHFVHVCTDHVPSQDRAANSARGARQPGGAPALPAPPRPTRPPGYEPLDHVHYSGLVLYRGGDETGKD